MELSLASTQVFMEKMWRGTRNNGFNISRKMPNFSPASGFPVRTLPVQALLKNETSNLTSTPKILTDGVKINSLSSHETWNMLDILSNEKRKNISDHKSGNLNLGFDFFGGSLKQNGKLYRQNIAIRSFEIGSACKMSLEALMSHLQDTALNHVRSLGLLADGYGSTPAMARNGLVWVVSSTQIQVDQYPSWTDVVEIDSWMYSSGKNGLGHDWVIQDVKTGETLIRATCLYLMMNKKTRRLSKFITEAREELAPYLMDCDSIINKDSTKSFVPFDVDTSDYVRMGLTPRWNDMDVNQHVNNVAYVNWILEGVPTSLMDKYELCEVTLKYQKECHRDSVLQSLSKTVNNGEDHSMDHSNAIEFDHSIRLQNGKEVLRGRTMWKTKNVNSNRYAVQIPGETNLELFNIY